MIHPIMQEALDMKQELVANRRCLHQIPEIGVELPQTVAFVTEKLREMGIEYTVYEDISCVVAVLGQGGRCILLRGDMDGLPVQEASGEPFSSTNGNMHACGHDMHTATMLGVAKILKAHEAELKGTVKLLFQSGEELFAGAKPAIEHGVLENPKVDTAFAMHVMGAMPPGLLVYGKYAMSSVYGFRISLTGKGIHGSMPELGIDPIHAAVNIYLGLQELIAREIPATEEAVLTVGHLEAGKANNVIPNEAVLEGTLRTFKPEITEYLIGRITEIAEGVAKTYRTQVKVETMSKVPATICDDACTDAFLTSAREVDGEMMIAPQFHAMGSEDFAFFSEAVPASYFALGAGVEDPAKRLGQHNPGICFNEDVLPRSVAIYVKVAMDWLENNPG